MKQFVIAALAAAVTAYDKAVQFKFMEYLVNHGKSYDTVEEYNLRLAMFAKAEKLINAHNAKESSYKLGHNILSDLTPVEYKQRLGYVSPFGDKKAKKSEKK